MTDAFKSDYFEKKLTDPRKEIADTGEKPFQAIETATKVLRLCYPWRPVKAVHAYYNNAPLQPFLRAEHPGLMSDDAQARRMRKTCESYLVVDVYFLFDDQYNDADESQAFVVEVAFPNDLERVRWKSIARVRWIDLGWNGEDSPVPQLLGETFMNEWI